MAEWPMKPFGELVDNFDAVRVPVKESDRRTGPYPYYGASGVVDRVDNYIFDGEYLLVAEDGENLRTRQTPIAFMAAGKFWVNNHAHIVRANGASDTRYLMYAIRCADVRSYLTGSTMPKLTQANMNRIPVVAPPLATQRVISRILGSLDDKIELNRRTNETLEAMARALFKSWFVDFDPVRAKAEGRKPAGMDEATAKMFPSELSISVLGQIPKGWEVGQIYSVANVDYGAPYASSRFNQAGVGRPVIRIRDLREQRATIWTDEIHLRDVVVAPGDVLVGMDGEFRAYVWSGAVSVLNQRVCRFNAIDRQDAEFVRLGIEAPLRFVERTEVGTTVIHLGKSDIDLFRIVLPPRALLDVFGQTVSAFSARLLALQAESRTLASVRDHLLPRLLSGELSVAKLVSQVEAAL